MTTDSKTKRFSRCQDRDDETRLQCVKGNEKHDWHQAIKGGSRIVWNTDRSFAARITVCLDRDINL